jgi:hypothetical protein
VRLGRAGGARRKALGQPARAGDGGHGRVRLRAEVINTIASASDCLFMYLCIYIHGRVRLPAEVRCPAPRFLLILY